MPPRKNKSAWIAGVVLVLVFGTFFVARFLPSEGDDHPQKHDKRPTPVEVAAVQRGTLSLHRTFSGSIEPQAQLTVAPKVSGRIQRLLVDVSERVTRGQVVAQLEDDEFKQAVVEAEARRAVAEANRVPHPSR